MKTRIIVSLISLGLLAAFQWWIMAPPTHADWRACWSLGVLWGTAFMSTIQRLRD